MIIIKKPFVPVSGLSYRILINDESDLEEIIGSVVRNNESILISGDREFLIKWEGKEVVVKSSDRRNDGNRFSVVNLILPETRDLSQNYSMIAGSLAIMKSSKITGNAKVSIITQKGINVRVRYSWGKQAVALNISLDEWELIKAQFPEFTVTEE